MRALLVSILALLSALGVAAQGGLFATDAEEVAGRYTLKAIAYDARLLAMMDGATDTTAYLAQALAEAPDHEALELVDGRIRWDVGTTCLELVGGPVDGDTIIVACSVAAR